MKRKQKAGKIIAWITGILAAMLLLSGPAAALGLGIFLNRHCDYKGVETRRQAMQGLYSAEEFGLTGRELTLETADGETLWAAEVAPEKPQAVLICLSGIMQPSVTYFYGQAKMLREDGVASLLLEVRSHGKSSGKRLGLGYTETADVQAAVDYLQSQPQYKNLPILVQGVSMGGAIALNAFGEIDRLAGCIAMSAYASFEEQLDLLMKQYFFPGFLRKYELFWMKKTLTRLYGQEAVELRKPRLAIQKAAGRPVCLIACREDSSVPVENTRRLSAAWPEAQVWIRDGWEHFIVKDCDFRHVEEDTEYCRYLRDFIRTVQEASGKK